MSNNYRINDEKLKSLYSECRFQFSRSSGPGGQKVNKTETRVELFWKIESSYIFSEEQKVLIANKLSNRVNKSGELIFSSDRYRTRQQNQSHCLRKLSASIEKALTKPKKRKKTKPTRSSIEKRIKDKKAQSDKKKMRQKLY